MRFHHPAIPIVLTALLIDSIGFGIVLPVLPGLMLAALLAACALVIVLFGVVRRLRPVEEKG